MIVRKSEADSAVIAARFLREGKLTVLPTDTIYGFSGIVPAASERIIAAKGRDEGKPFIQLIARPEDLALHCADALNPELLALWPGAVTVIVRNRAGGTTAFRCPGDQWLRTVISLTGAPIYSTSVNRAGEPAIKAIGAIEAEFGGVADLIVDDGDHPEGMASTLVDATGSVYRIVRQGAVAIPERCLRSL